MEAALNRALPTVLIPMLGGKNARKWNPPEIPDYDQAVENQRKRKTFSPFSNTKYDVAHEKDTFVDYQWWKVKDKGIIKESKEINIGGKRALDYQQHLDDIPDELLSKEDVDGLDQS